MVLKYVENILCMILTKYFSDFYFLFFSYKLFLVILEPVENLNDYYSLKSLISCIISCG